MLSPTPRAAGRAAPAMAETARPRPSMSIRGVVATVTGIFGSHAASRPAGAAASRARRSRVAFRRAGSSKRGMAEASPIPPVIILNAPQLAENIGAVARVMANFGLSELRLVNPRDGWPQERAWALASGAEGPLNAARGYATVAEAIADLNVVFAP